jgi:hypothetical protein
VIFASENEEEEGGKKNSTPLSTFASLSPLLLTKRPHPSFNSSRYHFFLFCCPCCSWLTIPGVLPTPLASYSAVIGRFPSSS